MADANTVVAATYVASVLEHMGYLTQADFLKNFQAFFRDAGALIYALAGIGGVVSVALYGSFRAVRYLLVGPALFWFLVGPTTESEGVLWKVGGGEYIGMYREQGEQSSKEFRQATLDKINRGEKGDGAINVAMGFYLFARPINDLVNEFVDLILDKENAEDLAVGAKVRGLEMISHILPYDADHLGHIEEFMSRCSPMMENATALAEYQVRQRGKQSLEKKGVTLQAPKLDEGAMQFKKQLQHAADNNTISLRESNLHHVVKWMKEGEGDSYDKIKSILDNIDPDAQTDITCGEAWAIIATETWMKAKSQTMSALRLGSGYWKYQEAKDEICAELTRKTTDDDKGECKVYPAIAMFMLYNHFKNMDTYTRIFARHKNQRDYTNPKADTITAGPIQRGMVPARVSGFGNNPEPVFRRGYNAYGHSFFEQLYVNEDAYKPGGNDPKVQYQWAPIAPISQLRGMDHAMWVATRHYESVKLRQQIVTYAMQLPNYQGAILFLISVIYPFMALIVLLPGRAHHFVNVPLAWLWAKSWDIGFAVVIVLDKVMYNLLPNWALEGSLREGPWTEATQLADVLTQGFFFDPWGSLHLYYTVIAMVTLGIPVLTGAVTLKARRGVLASFSDAAASQAKQRAEMAGAGYSVQAQSERNHMMMQIKGLAKLMAHGGAAGIDGGGKGAAAGIHTAMSMGPKLLNQQNIGKIIQGDLGTYAKKPEEGARAMAEFNSTYASNALGYAGMASALTSLHDPMIGRYGKLQMYEEAYAAAMDGGGVYELSGATDTAIDEMLKVAGRQDDSMFMASSNMRAVFGAKLGKGVLTAMSSTDGDRTGKMLTGLLAASVAAKLNANGSFADLKNMSLNDLKNLLEVPNMTDDELVAMLISRDRFMFSDAAGKRDLKALADWNKKMKATEGWIFGTLIDEVHGVLSAKSEKKYFSYGGPSQQMDIYMRAYGPERLTSNVPLQHPMMGRNGVMTAEQFEAIMPTVDGAGLLSKFEQMQVEYGLSSATKTTAALRTSNVIMLIGESMERRSMDYNQEIFNDLVFNRMAPGGTLRSDYEVRMERVQSNIVSYLGGGQEVANKWNSLGNGRTLSYNSNGTFTFSDGSAFDQVALGVLVRDYSRALAEDERKKISSSGYLGPSAAQLESEQLYHKLAMDAFIGYSELPTFTVKGKGQMDVVQLMNSAPMAALHVMEDWSKSYARSGEANMFDLKHFVDEQKK